MKGLYLFVILALMLSSCEEEEELEPLWYVAPEIIQDAINCYGRVVTLDDFNKGQLVGDTLNFLDRSIQGNLGYSPDSALVPMFFDKDKVLYSIKRYKKERKSRTDDFVSYLFWTDLSSFSGKVQYSDADPNNTKHIKNNKGEDMWVYDLYNRWCISRKRSSWNKKSRGVFPLCFPVYINFLIMIFLSTQYRSNSIYLF